MRKVKILAIAPYEGMAETISSLAADREDIEITVRVGNLHTGLKIARELFYHNYDVILSRGGTADLIREELDTPVVDAQMSAYDMLRSIKMAENYAKKFAIAGFQSITSCAYMLCDLLQLDIEVFTYESSKQAYPILKSLKDQGYSLVICDMIGSITAQSIGLNSIFVPSGTESIQAALNEAVKLVTTSSHIIKQKDIFQNVLIGGDEEVLIYDPRGNLWFSSLAGSDLKNPILNMIQTYLPAFTKTDHQIFEKQMDNCVLTLTNQHLQYEEAQYTIIKIHKKEALFKEEDRIVSIYNHADEPLSDFSAYHSSANYVGNIQGLIDEYSKTSFPILITGESGTGKDKAATLIYENGPYQNAPYYVIDCAMLNDRKWNSLISNDKSPFNNIHTTIYMKNIGKLSNTQFLDFTAFLEYSDLSRRNRLIFSLAGSLEENEYIRHYLADQLSCLLLTLPPLRERAQDIPGIATLYINQLNASMGKQIVGFEPEAMELILNYDWPHNLDQLRRIIKELVIVTKTSYITEDTVQQILISEGIKEEGTVHHGPGTGIDLNQTLDEISYDIIRIILKEESMNKERTAKRLGISRSTLWRILKAHKKD